MAHSRNSYSPLRAMLLKVLLSVGVPGLLIGLLLHWTATYRTPAQRAHESAVREQRRLLEEAERPGRERTEAIIRELEKDPVAIANEKAMAGMTPDQRAVRRKELEDAWKKKNGYR